MKPELTQKLKEQFFGKYISQRVMGDRQRPDKLFLVHHFDARSDRMYLKLRPLSDITDEEAIEVAKIVCARHNRHYKDDEISYRIGNRKNLDIIVQVKGSPRFLVQIDMDGIGFVEYWSGGAGKEHFFATGQYSAASYLLNIGIALPFMGHSVEELIAAGWVRLKEGGEGE